MPPRAASASRPTRSRSRTSGERAGGRVARPTRRQRASASALSCLRRHARPPCRASTPFSARPSAFGEIRAAPARLGRYFLKAKRPCPLIPADDLASFRNFPCVCGCVRSEENPANWLRPGKLALPLISVFQRLRDRWFPNALSVRPKRYGTAATLVQDPVGRRLD